MTQTNGPEVRLPRPPGVIRRELAAHPRIADIFILVWYVIGCGIAFLFEAAAASAPALSGQLGDRAEALLAPVLARGAWWALPVLRMLAVGAALYYRRRFPFAGLMVVLGSLVGDQSAQVLPDSVALVFLLYAVPVYRSVAAGWLGFGIVCLASAAEGVVYSIWPGVRLLLGPADSFAASGALASPAPTLGQTAAMSLTSAVWYLAVLMVGINVGNRRRYVEAIIDRAHQLALERDQRARLAVAEERSRIAREMHDIVAHSVSVMIALSEGAARTTERAPEEAADAMRRSAETGRTALTEMRRMLSALNDPGEASTMAPQPGIGDLPALSDGFRDAGIDVDLRVSGEGSESQDLSQELAVYRIVQEGLTNVLRYAGTGARAVVRVERSSAGTRVEVRDFGPVPGSTPLTGIGSGRGLAGLAERVRIFGGTIEYGPASPMDGGGWRLTAVLPSQLETHPVPNVPDKAGEEA